MAGGRVERYVWSVPTFLFLSFAVYPISCTKIMEYFDCMEFETDPKTYLTADPNIVCTSPDGAAAERYASYEGYIWLMVLIYPLGIPLMYLAFLLKHRKRLNPSRPKGQAVSVWEQQVIDQREHDPEIRHISFLWGSYHPRWFLFEVYDLIRKLVLTGLPLLISQSNSSGTGNAIAFGLM